PKLEVDAVLHRLRPFIFNQKIDDQRTNFLAIVNLLAKRIPCAAIWDPLRDRFKGMRTARMMQVEIGVGNSVRQLISQQALDDWLSAFEYHRNAKKAAQFKEIPVDFIGRPAVRGLMLELVAEKVDAIMRVGAITRALRGKGTIK